MEGQIPVNEAVGFIFALVRTASFMVLAPPFNNRSIPRRIKIGLAAGISLALAPKLPADQVSLEASYLMTGVITQTLTGLALGMICMILLQAVSLAGALIDLFGGFTLSMAMDPFSQSQSSIFGRFYSLIGTTMLFAINGHLMLIKGFLTSFEAVPLSGLGMESFTNFLLKEVGMLMLAACEIAGPLLAAYFLTEVALGMLSKAAPQMNIIQFGFPLKILLTLLMVGAALPIIPGALDSLLNEVLRGGMELMGSGGEA
jgi:flagellar biosynthetic protein FliR